MRKSHLLLGLILGGAGGCGGTPFGAPKVAPIVSDSMPAALKPLTTASISRAIDSILALLRVEATAHADGNAPLTLDQAVSAMFKNTYFDISGGMAQGIINTALQGLDTRVNEINSRSTDSSHACLSAATKSYHVDLSAVAPAFDLTLQLQCRDLFQSNGVSGVGSGMNFGKQGADNYSMWLFLNQAGSTGGFGYFANVASASTADKAVDYLFLEDSPAQSRVTGYRVKAKPAAQSFEFTYATSSNSDQLGCGIQMISDGTHIYAGGTFITFGQTCDQGMAFTKCFNATDLSELPDVTTCDTLKSTLTMTIPSAAAISTAGDTFVAALPISVANSVTSPF